MYILGINAYHGGAAACLIRDGQLVLAVEEERFNRMKYWAGFPVQAIQFCLKEAGISPHDLDHIAISRDPRANFMRKVLWGLRRRPRIGYVTDRLINQQNVARFDQTFHEALGLKDRVRAQFHRVEHHRAHMASAFFVSPFERAAVLSVDGMGDFVSTMWGRGVGNRIDVTDAIHFPHSLGLFYTLVTQWCGFPNYGDEGKTMGLSSFGQPSYVEALHDVVKLHRDGTFELNLDYFVHDKAGVEMSWREGTPTSSALYSQKFIDRFGSPRKRGEPIEERHENMANSLQQVLEAALEGLLRKLHAETGESAVVLAGGVALNGVFNGQIRQRTPFREIFIQPAAGDAGTALGAAYFVYHQLLGKPRTFVMHHAYTGSQSSPAEIAAELKRVGLDYEELDLDRISDAAADLLVDGNVVGWFQGRMEWGPRALGHRSIVADPRRTDMKDILNARIKHREAFRPFAPSILESATAEYFDQSAPDPFMVVVYNVLPEKRAVIPAVTHVDGTGRLQTVHPDHAPEFHSLITAFRERTGVPVVLNTSFNENEPIVRTPAEAIDCYGRTQMDALAIGNFLVRKRK